MASLASLKPSDTFDSLLHLDGETSGFTSALKAVEDGVGGVSALQLALTGQTYGASFNGNVGFGTVSPDLAIDIEKASITDIGIRIQNTDTPSADEKTQGIVQNYYLTNGSGGAELAAQIRIGKDQDYHGGGNERSAHMTFSVQDSETDFIEAMRIQNDGYVGIGTAAPSGMLHLESTSGVNQYITCINDTETTTGSLVFQKIDATDAMVDDTAILGQVAFQGMDADSGGSYISGAIIKAIVDGTPTDDEMPCGLEFWTNTGASAPVLNFMIAEDGGILAHNLLGASAATGPEVEYNTSTKEFSYESSDAALKTNIQAIPYGLAEINSLKPCMYDMHNWRIDTDGEGNNTGSFTKSEVPVTIGAIGLIAQEVAEAMPKLLNGDILKSYKRKELVTVMVKAIQELSAKVEALENA